MSNDVTAKQAKETGKKQNRFSRRHETSKAHDEAREAYKAKQDLKGPLADWERELLSGEPVDHSPATQLARLDARLGVGVGAVRERARLTAMM